ncbi:MULTISPECIES: CBS domain-containing protein [Streptomyces]|uniref:CBS domain-containing protein n=1 Tax=Streptomyces TaxID=1883 RepID=UPI001175426B|nr:CBS domain-containing protein [Streptomyces sp. SLBN-134]TQL18691.1 CBS domain protein [Streptomyces sp. SLBN-134]
MKEKQGHAAPARTPEAAGPSHEQTLLRHLSAMSAVSSRRGAPRGPTGAAGRATASPAADAAAPALLVRDVMRVPAPSVPWDLPFQEVARALAREDSGSLAVVDDDDHVVGVVSESDLLAKAAVEATRPRPGGALTRVRERKLLEKARGGTAEALMTSPAITVLPGMTVAEAAWLVALSRLKRAPVTDHDGRLVGTVRRSALLRALIRDDAGIEREVRHLLTVVAGAGAAHAVRVEVHGGVVGLSGPLAGDAATGLLAEVASMEDVVEVRDHLDRR